MAPSRQTLNLVFKVFPDFSADEELRGPGVVSATLDRHRIFSDEVEKTLRARQHVLNVEKVHSMRHTTITGHFKPRTAI